MIATGIRIQKNPLVNKLWACPKRIITVQGGGDAGKTVSILQVICAKLTQHAGWIATVTGRDLPNLKGGALRTFQRYVLPNFGPYIVNYNKSDQVYTFYNGAILEFKSFDSEADCQGSERDILFINEAQALPYTWFWQLQRKTRYRVFMDYNPTAPFWAHDKLREESAGFERQFFGKVQLYIVDHRHNRFLSSEEHEAYESISDPDLFRVYSRGLTGSVRGLIFGHFKKIELFPERGLLERVIWGIDYGYTTDPTAIVKVGVKGRQRWGKECSYEAGLSDEAIKSILEREGLVEGDIIYSEADPNMINQLRQLGLPVYPAIKGPGSVAAGIAKVREHECFYTADSLNFEKELAVYKFLEAEDIVTGKVVTINQPVKGWDHCCDGFRYADYTDSVRMARA